MFRLSVSLLLCCSLTWALPATPPGPAGRKIGKARRQLNLCNNVPTKQGIFGNSHSKMAKQFSVCDYEAPEGFHFICNAVSYDDAWQACAEAGWRLAVINSNDSSSFDAFDITDACIPPEFIGAWVASYDGMGGLPCMYMQRNGTLVQSNGFNCDALLPAICQDLAPATLTIPSGTTVAILTETTTATIQVCPTSPCNCARNCRRGGCRECVGRRNYTDALGNVDRWPRCCDPQGCDPLCPTALNDLYIINAGPNGIPFNLADRECREYGLHLADLTSALLPSFGSLSSGCVPEGEMFWIRSFNGVGGHEQCVWADGAQLNAPIGQQQFFPIGYGVIDGACFNLNISRILCQDRPPAQLGHGPFLGASVIATTVTEGLVYLSTATTLTITTATFFP